MLPVHTFLVWYKFIKVLSANIGFYVYIDFLRRIQFKFFDIDKMLFPNSSFLKKKKLALFIYQICFCDFIFSDIVLYICECYNIDFLLSIGLNNLLAKHYFYHEFCNWPVFTLVKSHLQDKFITIFQLTFFNIPLLMISTFKDIRSSTNTSKFRHRIFLGWLLLNQ